jgi:hypothetical protein
MFVTTPPFPWYSVLIVALVALDGRVEWLALALAVYVSTVSSGIGIDGPTSASLGYGLALFVTLAASYVRYLRRVRRLRLPTSRSLSCLPSTQSM